MAIERFEDIKAWQQARQLTRVVYQFTNDGAFSKDFGLRDQIRRAAVSVMANIAEGFDRRSRREFRNFLHIALSSLTETKSHLYVAMDAGYISQAEFDATYEQCNSAARLIFGFIRYLSEGIAQAHPADE